MVYTRDAMEKARWIMLALVMALPAVFYRVGGVGLWVVAGVGYGLAAAVALWALYDDGQLRSALLPRQGDATFGLVTAMLFFVGLTYLVTKVVAPRDALRYCALDGAWYAQPLARGFGATLEWARDRACMAVGRSGALQGPARGLAVALVAAAEEVAWRAGVQQLLSERIGSTRGWVVASLLFALAELGTGNPVVALLALPLGFAWGALYRARGRVAPALLSHVAFSWFFFANASPLVFARHPPIGL